jgi:hypothetical protein
MRWSADAAEAPTAELAREKGEKTEREELPGVHRPVKQARAQVRTILEREGEGLVHERERREADELRAAWSDRFAPFHQGAKPIRGAGFAAPARRVPVFGVIG